MSAARRSARRAAALVVVVGLAVTGAFTAAAAIAHTDNEERITQRRTLEAAAVLEAAIPGIELPLAVTAAVSELTSGDGAGVFVQAIRRQVGPQSRFVSASLWRAGADGPVASVGAEAVLSSLDAEDRRAFMRRALAADGLVVLDLLDRDQPRIGYAFSGPGTGEHAVYAEQALPSDRTGVPRDEDAFSGLDYALYLGRGTDREDLVYSSTESLPLEGRTGRATIPFGDTSFTLVMSPTEVMGGELLAVLPWIILATGAVFSTLGGVLVFRLQRRRADAEALASENEHLYREQRDRSEQLQRSLLPDDVPRVAGFEIAASYHPGGTDTEVGGDWYDLVPAGGALVAMVGDVSGRGLDAAAVMASIRFGMHALAARGETPDAILSLVDRVGTVDRRGHFATALCAAVDLVGGTVTVSTAGHPPPLLLDADPLFADVDPRFIDVPVHPPLGVGAGGHTYTSTVVVLPARGTLILMTDGLFERRGEDIDDGLARVRSIAGELADRPVRELVDELIARLDGAEGRDDTAVVALRWGSDRVG